MSQPFKVLVVGGTHGNEFSGVQLFKQWQQQPLDYPELSIALDMGNPSAHQINRRYVDKDLNREFTLPWLADPSRTHCEGQRAKVLNQQYGPKGADSQTDLVIDLHNTTSNMGPTLILLADGPWERQLAAYVKHHMKEAVILLELEKPYQEWGYLCTLGRRGVMVEVGPQANSVLRHDVLVQMDTMTQLVLAFCALEQSQQLPALPSEIEAFSSCASYSLPLDKQGQPLAMVHQRLEGRDFEALEPGEPIFQYFDGQVGTNPETRTLYPTFVNEAAYYDSHGAFSLAEKITLTIPA